MIKTKNQLEGYPVKFANNRKKTRGRKYSFTSLKRVAVHSTMPTALDLGDKVIINTRLNVVDVKYMNAEMLIANSELVKAAGDKVVNKMSVTNTSRKTFQ